jgi:hypothetical protein
VLWYVDWAAKVNSRSPCVPKDEEDKAQEAKDATTPKRGRGQSLTSGWSTVSHRVFAGRPKKAVVEIE